jgi:hypothetical protein
VELLVLVRCGPRALKGARLLVEVRNLSTRKAFRREVADLGGNATTIRLDPKVLGEGQAAAEVTLLSAESRPLGKAVAAFEIVEDPFAP